MTVQLELSDGRATLSGTFVDPGPLLDDPVGRAMLFASMWKAAAQRLRPTARPASARSSAGQPPGSASLGQLAADMVCWPGKRPARRLRRRRATPSRVPARTSPRIACPPFDRRAFGRERPGLCRFLPTALTEAEVDEVDIDEPGFEAWPSAEPWAEAVAALEGYTLEEVVGAEVVGAESAPSSPEPSGGRIAVECTRCSKWRLVNEGEGAEDDDKWECALNDDAAHNTCKVAQEMTNEVRALLAATHLVRVSVRVRVRVRVRVHLLLRCSPICRYSLPPPLPFSLP